MLRITLLSIAVLALLMPEGCGGEAGGGGSTSSGGGTGGSPPAPPATTPGTYTFVITTRSGNVEVNSTYMLTVLRGDADEITPQTGVNLPEPSFPELSLTFPYG